MLFICLLASITIFINASPVPQHYEEGATSWNLRLRKNITIKSTALLPQDPSRDSWQKLCCAAQELAEAQAQASSAQAGTSAASAAQDAARSSLNQASSIR